MGQKKRKKTTQARLLRRGGCASRKTRKTERDEYAPHVQTHANTIQTDHPHRCIHRKTDAEARDRRVLAKPEEKKGSRPDRGAMISEKSNACERADADAARRERESASQRKLPPILHGTERAERMT